MAPGGAVGERRGTRLRAPGHVPRAGEAGARSTPASEGLTFVPLSLVVVFVLATLGSFGAAFGVATDCTNTYDCTSDGCSPCRAAIGWLYRGWAAQGVLLLLGATLAVLASWQGLRAARPGAVLVGPVSIALFVATLVLANRSF